MAIKSMSLAWISVSDIKKAKEFFTNTVGLDLTVDSPEYGWLELKGKQGGFALGVGQASEQCQLKAGQNAVVCFDVDNIEETKKDLESKGVKVANIEEVPGHVKLAFFTDEDGNLFHLAESLSK
jgi:catechol 2,3-dioxygenase-like lactoylglutathione lyase family enzyme